MIAIRNLSHRIGGATILDEVSLDIPRGGITAIIGPNGAGKSTLMGLAARLIPLQDGRVEIDGQDIARTPTEELARRLAIVTQRVGVASRLRVGDLVGFGRWPHHRGRPGPADHAAVEHALEAFDLTALRHRFLDELSGGQNQRAFIAMGLAQETEWLLLDEPLNNLDMFHARRLMARIHALSRAGGRSVVMVVHDINYAAAWADHVVALKDGRLDFEGAPREVLTGARLSALFGMEIAVEEIRGRPTVLHHA
ncbi:iron ABC transporter ATP-binding protein [Mangrovicoccus algicola]|uniref:ATP-binding cassette domain-containing protein n=1 Tax=Mangrovicoccus algicola TaxID=2771008 RepID=A0A8J7CK24_9RHOB|nr:ATP-binding cassette domain-containing protein [Mangrovicoccus algicola]MBE3638221.1 ATP-binding cassette domain-containing protein [Mangrovicoccus algicola]